jgi:hypothetical protein
MGAVHVKTAAIKNVPFSKYQNSKYWAKKKQKHLIIIGKNDSFRGAFGKPVTIATHTSKIKGIINLRKTTHSNGSNPSINFPSNKFIEVHKEARHIKTIPSKCLIRLVTILNGI